MRMTDHALNAASEYHFESSDEYCAPELVDQAAGAVRTSHNLNPADRAQLQAIVDLEKLRFAFAYNDISLKEHGQQIQALRKQLIERHGREPFDNGKIEKAFYQALNQAYGYAD
ncbi:hypothetical protein [Novosphingobium sp. MBES04]|uniref:hypothetical protein n=1 Tax=Novosphingobium sp. MBES04 TaxID=1206458 RepID=UPI001184CA91|nr:hypothetical protein [Novosphingobium sp. MBES04]